MRVLAIVCIFGITAVAQSPALHLPPLDESLPARAETIDRAIRAQVHAQDAMGVAHMIASSWRIAANPRRARA